MCVEESVLMKMAANPETLDIVLGKTTQKYLLKAKDNKFGLYLNTTKISFINGASTFGINYDIIIIYDKSCKVIYGFWILLTFTDSPSNDLYTEYTFKNYSIILFGMY